MAQLKSTNINGNLAVTGNIVASNIDLTNLKVESIQHPEEGGMISLGAIKLTDLGAATTPYFLVYDNTTGQVCKGTQVTNYLPLAGGSLDTNAKIIIPVGSGRITRYSKSDSNYVQGIEWLKGSTATSGADYEAHIGWHNTGDGGRGLLVISPTASSNDSDGNPWDGNVGLSISKSALKYYGKEIATKDQATISANGLMSADDKKNLTYYVKGTQTASTNAWTGELAQVSALYEGLTIRYRLPYAGTSSGATLNLTLSDGTTTGAQKIYRYGTSTQVAKHFAAGSIITMTYNGTNWIVDAFYYTDASVRQYQHGEDEVGATNKYPLLARYNLTNKNGSYDTSYSRFHTEVYVDISDGSLTAKGFKYNDATTGTDNYILLAGGGTKAISDFDITITDTTNATTKPIISDITEDGHTITVSRIGLSDLGLASAYKYKGSKDKYEDLPTSNNVEGDVWNVADTGMNYSWTGSAWDALGSTIDLSGYATKDDIAKYLPLAGNTNSTLMTGPIKYSGKTQEIISIAPEYQGGSWKGGIKYSWDTKTTIALWGAHKDCQFVWHAGADLSEGSTDGWTNRNYDFQVGRNSSSTLEALLGGKLLATQEWVGKNYTNNTGTVTSITAGTGLTTASGSAITTSGTISLDVAGTKTALGLKSAAYTDSTAYATSTQGSNADTAYGWGNHANAGYVSGTYSSGVLTLTIP